MKQLLVFWIFFVSFLEPINVLGAVPKLMEHTHYGALVVNLDNGQTVCAHQSKLSFAPASLTKLITTATAFELLSPDFTYKTTLSYTGAIENEMIVGDIVVKGSGDPTLGSSCFMVRQDGFLLSWVNHLKKNGIRTIQGDLIVDASVFDRKVLGDKWIWEDIGNYYGAGVYGLSFMDNRYTVRLKSGAVGAPVQLVEVLPLHLNMDFECLVTGADNGRDNAYIYGSPWTFERRIRGTIPAHRESFEVKGAMPNPPLVFGRMFKSLLESSGVQVYGDVKVKWESDKRKSTLLSTWVSPSLSEIARETNKESNNLYAEHLMKSLDIGIEPAQCEDAIAKLMDFWQAKGIDCTGVKLYDGSGLSRANLLTPQCVVDVLRYMDKSANAEMFKNSLAIAGYDGTFKYFLDHTPLAQKVIGKSGGMSSIRCYAGYIEWQKQRYAFCVMLNNSTASMAEMKAAIEAYLLHVFN